MGHRPNPLMDFAKYFRTSPDVLYKNLSTPVEQYFSKWCFNKIEDDIAYVPRSYRQCGPDWLAPRQHPALFYRYTIVTDPQIEVLLEVNQDFVDPNGMEIQPNQPMRISQFKFQRLEQVIWSTIIITYNRTLSESDRRVKSSIVLKTCPTMLQEDMVINNEDFY